MRKIVIVCLMLLLGACSSETINPNSGSLIESINQDDYAVLIPFDSSPIRDYHGTYLGRPDFMEVGSRLLDKSKAYFDPKDYYLSEGQILTPTLLGNLVKRESSDNPYGLNPPSGSLFPSGNGEVTLLDAVIVADIVETDFYQGDSANPQLAGISFAIILNQTHTLEDGAQISITTDRLYTYGSDMGRKLERYIRTLTDLEDMPLYITLYSTESMDSTLPGHFMGEGYFDGRSGQFSDNTENWALFPSSQASLQDPVIDASFLIFRRDVQDFIPEAIGIIGEGRYVENDLDFLRLTLTIQAKTFTEVHALIQYVASLLEGFEQKNYVMIVKINSISETLALIQRDLAGNITVIEPY